MTRLRRGFSSFLRGSFVLLLLTVCASAAYAQTAKGSISGSVIDANGAGVPNAQVKATNPATGAVREVTASDDGAYNLTLLDIGAYTVEATAPNFQTYRQEGVRVEVGSTTALDIRLQPGNVTDVITVTAGASLVQSETSERGDVISGREVTELPLSGRNFTRLATLTPGVAPSSNTGFGGTGADGRQFNNGDPRAGSGGPGSGNAQGSTETSRFARSGGGSLTVNGQRPTNNNFSLDGVDNNEPQFGTIGVFPNPDAIAEFKVTTSIPPAEVGRASGAVINTTIQSGRNDFFGSLYYYGQNSALNAYHPMLKRDRALSIGRGDRFIPEKAVQQIHEFGGTVGGRIIRDRTFFFFDFLGQRNNLPFPAASTTPTARSRTGDFSEFPQIFNPFTGQPFAGNQIPSGLINPIARRFFEAHPLPTANVFNPGQFNNNYFTQRSNKEEINNYGIKVDHRLTDNNSLTGRFNWQDLKTVRSNLLPGLPTAGFGAGEEVGDTRQLTISDTHTFSPTVLNEFRFGYTTIDIGIFNCGVGGACGVSPTFAQDIGIPNVNDGSLEQSGGTGLGTFGTGFTEFTGDGGLFLVKSKNPYFADTVTVVKGNQVIKFGGEVRLRYLETIDGGRSGFLKGNLGYGDEGVESQPIQPGQVCPAASITGGGTQCFVDPNGVPYGGTGNAQANLLLGLPAFQASRGRVFGGPFNLRTQEYGFFVQDDWKVNDRLTMNLGLRWDLFTSPTEASGRLSYYDPARRAVVVASGSDDRMVELDKNNFGPRIGFAYSVNSDKTMVLRGGYGLLYTLDGLDYPPGIRNPPFTNTVNFNQFQQAPGQRTYFGVANGPPSVTTQIDPANLPSSVAVYSVEREQKTTFVHQFQLSMQWQFAKDYSLDVGYVGNRSRNLLATFDLGGSGQATARNAANQIINSATLYSNSAESSYDGLQTQLQKRLSNNFQGQISYTWSHTIDNNPGLIFGLGDSRTGGRSGPINPFNLDADRGNSPLDIRHLLSANAIIDLPFGSGQPYLNYGGAADKFVGGWQLNFIVSGRSGFPFTAVCSNQLVRPRLVGDPFAGSSGNRYLNPAAFDCSSDPATTPGFIRVDRPGTSPIFYGGLGRNTFRGPAIWNTDMSVFKNTNIFSESTRLQIGLEFFNLFNHTNLTVPDNNVSDLGAPVGTGGFGRFNGAFPGRVVQYRVKLIFK